MRYGIVILPEYPWPEARERWVRAEQLGFDTAWTYDHLSWRSLADGPWHATIPTLTAAAAATTRIRLGTFVASPNFRHPVPFAKDLATLDDIAGGRVTLGVGSGGTGFDATVLGQQPLTPRERHARFTEFVHDLDRLLRFEAPGSGGVSFSGDWFQAVHARMVGVPAQRPRMPLVVAADGPRGMRLAAAIGDGWVTLGAAGADTESAWWDSVRSTVAKFEEALAATGREHPIERHLSLDAGPTYALRSASAFEDAAARAADLGFTEVTTHWPRRSGIYSGDEAVLEHLATTVLTPHRAS